LDLNGRTPKREELLNIWGIGPETADSILLYAYAQPEFVVDAYTKRIFTHLGIISPCASYEEVKATVQEELETDFRVFQELHALLVEHAKRWYAKKPYSDPLLEIKTQQGK
jgi:endonuclease-3 related protein